MSVYDSILWVNEHIFVPMWVWLNSDLGGLTIYKYVIFLALFMYVGTWVVGRFKKVAHERYDDYYEIANSRIEGELHQALSSVEKHTGFDHLTGFGDRWSDVDNSFNVPEPHFESDNGAFVNVPWSEMRNLNFSRAERGDFDNFSSVDYAEKKLNSLGSEDF